MTLYTMNPLVHSYNLVFHALAAILTSPQTGSIHAIPCIPALKTPIWIPIMSHF